MKFKFLSINKVCCKIAMFTCVFSLALHSRECLWRTEHRILSNSLPALLSVRVHLLSACKSGQPPVLFPGVYSGICTNDPRALLYVSLRKDG